MLSSNLTHSQNVSGTVSDNNGPLPGASVLLKGTTNGTQTDFVGAYSLKNVGANSVLVFSYMGFKSQEISVSGKNTINVQLEEESNKLSEVVVIGYGTIKRKDATGAVETIKSEDFNKGVVTTPEQLFQGKAAGVIVTSASGEPGAANNVKIRGISSFRAGSEPLYVVDGLPIAGGDATPGTQSIGIGTQSARNPLNFINPADIESIDVLKDASATAIYGSRGANGVIIITTKKGKKGSGQFTFNTSQTFSEIANDYDLLSKETFVANTPAVNNFGGNVNAWDEITRTALTKQYDLGYAGGSENGTYRLSFGYTDQEGVINNTGLEKYNAGINLTQNMFDSKLKFETSLVTSYLLDESAALSDNIGAEGDLIVSAIKWNPTRNFYNPDGSFLQISDNQRNPLDLLKNYSDNTKTARILGNFATTLTLFKGLDYKFNVGVDYANSNRDVGASKLIGVNDISSVGGVAQKINLNRSNYLFEHTLNYNASIAGNLKLNAIAGYTYQRFESEGYRIVGTKFGVYTDQNYYLNNITAATEFPINGLFAQTGFTDPSVKLQSYFARSIFTLSDKYIFSALVRRDGSSKFGANNKYGTFPAVSFAWKVDQEDFMPESISTFKIRGGWGVTGNQEFPAGAASLLVKPVNGVPQVVNTANPELKWEETTQINAGIEFGLFNDRLNGSVDVYSKETVDPLLIGQVGVPAQFEEQWKNLANAKIQSKGIEISLNYKIINNANFKWNIGGNVAFLNSSVDGLVIDGLVTGIQTGTISGQGLSGVIAQVHTDGETPYSFNLLQFDGFDSNGISKYKDLNNDTFINDLDKRISGSALPNMNIGINTSIQYKNFDFNASGYGAYGQEIYNNTANALFFKSLLTSGNNVPNSVPTSAEAATGNSNSPSTRFLEKGDFFRLANVQVGYTLNGKVVNFDWLKSIRFYATATNLFVITPYTGLDPEVNSNKQFNGIPSLGIDYNAYPRSRAFSLGLNINL